MKRFILFFGFLCILAFSKSQNYQSRVTEDSSKRVGINTTTPTATLHIQGDLKVSALPGGAGKSALRYDSATGIISSFDTTIIPGFVPKAHYIVVTGQSNANNNDATPGNWHYDTTAQIKSWNGNAFVTANPAINNIAFDDIITAERNHLGLSFAKQLLVDHPYDTVYILNSSKGSQGSWLWTPKTTGNGEQATSNIQLTTLFTKLNATPASFKADVLIWQQGENDDTGGNIPYWLDNTIEFRDTCARSAKFNSNFTMLVNYPVYAKGFGLYDSLAKCVDSIIYAKKDLANRKILGVGYDFPNNFNDTSHFTNGSIEQIGAIDYHAYKSGISYRNIPGDSSIIKKGTTYKYLNEKLVLNGSALNAVGFPVEIQQNGSANLLSVGRTDNGSIGRQQTLRIFANNSAYGGFYLAHYSENSAGQLSLKNALIYTDSSIVYSDSTLIPKGFLLSANTVQISNPLTLSAVLNSNSDIRTSGTAVFRNALATAEAVNIGTTAGSPGNFGGIKFTIGSGQNGSPAAAVRAYHNGTGGALALCYSPTFSTLVQGLWINNDGNIAIGSSTLPTARLHLPAGAAAVGTAPMKFTAGTVTNLPENGAVEYDGVDYYVTSGGVRFKLQKITAVPATATSPGVAGSIAYDASFLYVCVAANTWVRASLSSW